MTPYRDCDNDCAPGSCQDYPCADITEAPAPFWVRLGTSSRG